MAIQAGVWLDHKQAIVVLQTDQGQEIKKIAASDEQPAGGAKAKNAYTPNDFIAEDKQERKRANHIQKYFDEVLACIRGAEALLILGPGEAKGEFHKRLVSKKIRVGTVAQETTGKLTDRQIVAKVSQHFAATKPKKQVAARPKKAVKKKGAKAASGSRQKKSK